MKWFSSDWHLGHKATLELGQRDFKNVKEMDKTIIENMVMTPNKGDILYFLGDFGWDEEAIFEMIFRLSKRKIRLVWILGNHDKRYEKKFLPIIKQQNKLNAMYDMYETKLTDKDNKHYPTILCHYPMLTWNRSHYNSFQLYGHHHANTWKNEEMDKFEKTGKKLNVCCEFHSYKPISELEVISMMKTRPDNWDLIKRN